MKSKPPLTRRVLLPDAATGDKHWWTIALVDARSLRGSLGECDYEHRVIRVRRNLGLYNASQVVLHEALHATTGDMMAEEAVERIEDAILIAVAAVTKLKKEGRL